MLFWDMGERLRCRRANVASRAGRIYLFGQPKVEDLSVPTLRNENICWFDITMNDVFGVGSIESVRDLDGQREQHLNF